MESTTEQRQTMKTTGKYSIKPYHCERCGNVEQHGTNHWGEFYNTRCKGCSWKNPLDPFVTWICDEPLPEGYEKPTPWKKATLGEICEIK